MKSWILHLPWPCLLLLVPFAGPVAAEPKVMPFVLDPRDAAIEHRIDACQSVLWNLENLVLVRTDYLDRTIGNDARLLPIKRTKAQKALEDTLARYGQSALSEVQQQELARARLTLASVDQQLAEQQQAQRTLDDIKHLLADLLVRKFAIAEQLDAFTSAWARCAKSSARCTEQPLPILEASLSASRALLDKARRELSALGIDVPPSWEQSCITHQTQR